MKKALKTTNEIVRYNPDCNSGLSIDQINQRKKDNLVNNDTTVPTKTIPRIFFENIVTLFNILNILLAIAILCVGSYKNLLFMGVIICNTLIGTFQEIRAKKAVDKLSLISSTKVNVVRNSKIEHIPIKELVLDDIVYLKNGNQIVSDCIVVDGKCEVNESLLTGESDPITKKKGDMLLSGSFIVSGSCKAKIEHIGNQNYAAKISNDAKYIKKVNSEIMYTLNLIIKIISFIIIPLGIMLFYKQFNIVESNTYQNAVVHTVAALIGMIPEGLILLTSTVLAVGVIRLSKQKVLVQELYCIETLARVDTLCLDKTGTITDGNMEVINTVEIDKSFSNKINEIMSSMVHALNDNNPTFNAIRDKFGNKKVYDAIKSVPFSSEKKWSGVYFKNEGSFILGAAEFILNNNTAEIEDELKEYASKNRVLILAHSNNDFNGEDIPKDTYPIAFIIINDKIRKQAKETLKYFKEQGVDIKIISGDNVLTVSNVAKAAGLDNADNYIDATTLENDEDLKQAAQKYSVFGRVTPQQKKKLIVALKDQGHTVAMTGDGVNDVLALKEADCSVAMASGSDAARNVSQLVLLNSCFDSMPKVVAEGRRSINNIQRSASLFLVKTLYSLLLSILFIFINMPYPFMPIQMTLISMFTIGIPSFILALEPNNERIKGNFFINIISKSIPAAISVVLNILSVILATNIFKLSIEEFLTISVILTGYTGLLLLFKISLPLNNIRKVLIILMSSGFAAGIIFGREIFSLALLNAKSLFILMFLLILSTVIFICALKSLGKLINKYKTRSLK